ncbi:hypothetical protein CK203_080462 [Vitis vinifera]|uniref:Reverse transcriptase zinc-binding domain-containing protein n=1 Tax=Vitis vinifera TaxID=29760 RepID=A0A438E7D1_VITVI|nr:hypothetical protein CK203_080462 [Vitis vinifera]
MAVQRNSTVEEMWDQNSGQGNWNLNFLRDFNDWELELVGDFLHILRGHKPSLEEDSVLWRKGRNGQFRVKEAYSLLVRSDDTGFPSRSIWVARVPTKVAFFAWEATWGKVLALDRLQRRGLQLPNRCFLVWLNCKGGGGKLLETPGAIYTKSLVGRVWKVLEMPRDVHTSLHYGGRHGRSPRLSRDF